MSKIISYKLSPIKWINSDNNIIMILNWNIFHNDFHLHTEQTNFPIQKPKPARSLTFKAAHTFPKLHLPRPTDTRVHIHLRDNPVNKDSKYSLPLSLLRNLKLHAGGTGCGGSSRTVPLLCVRTVASSTPLTFVFRAGRGRCLSLSLCTRFCYYTLGMRPQKPGKSSALG